MSHKTKVSFIWLDSPSWKLKTGKQENEIISSFYISPIPISTISCAKYLKGETEIKQSCLLASLSNTYVHSSDEFELEFFSSSQAMKVPSQAKLGHFNLQAETELKILTICMSKNGKF